MRKQPTICWLVCKNAAEFIVYQKSYGPIIGFCSEHRPELRVEVSAAWANPEADETTMTGARTVVLP
jgi:hypothetical protein